MNEGKECRHKEERCHCGQQQSADHRASQRSVLLTAVAQAERHRHHADDHGQGGHQHRAEADKAGIQRGAPRVAHQHFHLLARETHHQDGVSRGDTHAHDGAGKRRYAEPGVGQEQEPHDSGQRRRQCGNDEKWVQPGLEVDHDEQVNQHHGENQATEQANIGPVHGLALPAQDET